MKKLFVFLLFSLFLWAPCVAGDGDNGGDDGDGNTEVPMQQPSSGGHNRGQQVVPEVYYNPSTGVMTVTFAADDAFTLAVTDATAHLVYQTPITTSGVPTAYVLNLASPDVYVITIASASEAFTGVLALD